MIRPPYLKDGDLVAIVATARSVDRDQIQAAGKLIEDWGLQVVYGSHLFDKSDQFAGDDTQRLNDLQWAIDQPNVRAIFCARGGYGTTRILDGLNFSTLLQYPKWICGFSDVTGILCHLHKLNMECIHSIMPLLYHQEGQTDAVQSLKHLLFGEEGTIESAAHEFNRFGKAKGPIVGGNLSLLVHLMGTSSELETRGKILFLEDLDEYLYHLDRMMVQLQRAGKLDRLAGLLVGHMTDMNDHETPFGQTAHEIVKSHVDAYDYPVAFGFPVGHAVPNLAMPVGREGTLQVTSSGSRLTF